jgi:hypothetical protein
MDSAFTYIVDTKIWIFSGLVLVAAIALVRWYRGLRHPEHHHLPTGQEPHSAAVEDPASLLNEGSPSDRDNARIAAGFFCGAEKYNCAQAILRTYQQRFTIPDADIVAARKKGYGKVPGGLCGALYAGKLLLGDERRSQQLTREFENQAGSASCKQILKLKYISCKECVAVTARLLDGLLD